MSTPLTTSNSLFYFRYINIIPFLQNREDCKVTRLRFEHLE